MLHRACPGLGARRLIESDYIMRLVAQLTQALARILGLRRAGKVAEAEVELDAVARSLVGLDLESMGRLPASALAMLVAEPERCAVAARILKEHGELVWARDPAAATASWRKAFALLDGLDQRGALPPEAGAPETLAWLVKRLS